MSSITDSFSPKKSIGPAPDPIQTERFAALQAGVENMKGEFKAFREERNREAAQRTAEKEEKETERKATEKRIEDMAGELAEMESRLNDRKLEERLQKMIDERLSAKFSEVDVKISSMGKQIDSYGKAADTHNKECAARFSELEKKINLVEVQSRKYTEEKTQEVITRTEKELVAVRATINTTREQLDARIKEAERQAKEECELVDKKFKELSDAVAEDQKKQKEYDEGQRAYVDGRFDAIEKRIDALAQKLDALSAYIDQVKAGQDGLLTKLKEIMEKRLTEFETSIQTKQHGSYTEIVVRLTALEESHKSAADHHSDLITKLTDEQKKKTAEDAARNDRLDDLERRLTHTAAQEHTESPPSAAIRAEVEEKLRGIEETSKNLKRALEGVDEIRASLAGVKRDIAGIKDERIDLRALELKVNELGLSLINRTKDLQSKFGYIEERFETFKVFVDKDSLRGSQAKQQQEEEKAEFARRSKESPARKSSPPHYLREDAIRSRDDKKLLAVSGTKPEDNISTKHFRKAEEFSVDISEIPKVEAKEERVKTKYSDITDFREMDFENVGSPVGEAKPEDKKNQEDVKSEKSNKESSKKPEPVVLSHVKWSSGKKPERLHTDGDNKSVEIGEKGDDIVSLKYF